jgi:hypothetical protein
MVSMPKAWPGSWLRGSAVEVVPSSYLPSRTGSWDLEGAPRGGRWPGRRSLGRPWLYLLRYRTPIPADFFEGKI